MKSRVEVLERQVEQLQGLCEVLVEYVIVSLEAMDPTGRGATMNFKDEVEALHVAPTERAEP